MRLLGLALRMLLRDLRAGELGVMAIALVLAVAALTSVSFLADRVAQGVQREARQLLGGDLLLTADHPWPEAFRAAARAQGLRLAESASLLSMVSTGSDRTQLAEIKAVSPDYPLRGVLRIAPRPGAADVVATAGPAVGQAWGDERLASLLEAGDAATLHVGALALRMSAIVTLEPERSINPFALAPRLIIPLEALPATGLLLPGSRVGWRLHVAGDDAAVAAFRAWATPRLGRGERIEGLDNARPEVRSILDRAERFLRLAALLTVVLAAVAIGMAARRYLARHLEGCAVMRCLGASERDLLMIHGGEFILLGLAATLGGGLLGYLGQGFMHSLLVGLVASELPPPGVQPWLLGAAISLVLVAGFILPPLLRLKAVPTVRVLRREWGDGETASRAALLVGVVCLGGLMLWLAGDLRLGALVLGGFTLAVVVFALAGTAILALLRRLPTAALAAGWRIGLASLQRRRNALLVQAVALALGLTTLLLTLMQNDLLAAWRTQLPADAPNRFLINIQPEQRTAVEGFFAREKLPVPRLEPMVRGRLTAINGRAIGPQDFAEERARHLVEREFNLSSRDDLPAGNRVAAGRWPEAEGRLQFSVEQGLADTLGLKLHDSLTFQVAGQAFSADITSLRKLDWGSMRVNFFVIAPAGSLDGQPTSFITSFHLPAGQEGLIGRLVGAFPNLTVIDVASLVRQLQSMLDQIGGALRLVFGFSFLAGLLVLVAALQTVQAERRAELALLRALGARQRQLRQVVQSEFLVLGMLAGGLAALGAGALATLLARQVFQLDYLPASGTLLAGLAAGLLAVALTGALAWRRTRKGSLIEALRSS